MSSGTINLATLGGGVAIEKFNEEFQRLIENVLDPNTDDGVTQSVTARAGIAKVANVSVPNPVTLRPFRTFSEIEQPASKYVLRMKKGGELPTAALFEVGGEQWKHDAVGLIADKLAELLGEKRKDVSIFA